MIEKEKFDDPFLSVAVKTDYSYIYQPYTLCLCAVRFFASLVS